MSKPTEEKIQPASVPEEDKPPKVQWETFKDASLLSDADVKRINEINIDIVDENSIRQITKSVVDVCNKIELFNMLLARCRFCQRLLQGL